MNLLSRLGNQHGTDKGDLHHTHHGMSYLDHYDRLFAPRRNEVTSVLEIGVFKGNSLRMWRDYFPNAQIHGLDIDPECDWNSEERIEITIGSQDDADLLRSLPDFDIVIDDGSHIVRHMITSFDVLWPKTHMFYCLEDTGCTYKSASKDWPGMHLNDEIPPNFRHEFEELMMRRVREMDLGQQHSPVSMYCSSMQTIFSKI